MENEMGIVGQFLRDLYHSALHEVGFGTLNRHVGGGAFGGITDDEVGRLHIRGRATAAEESFYVALFSSLLESFV